MKPELTIQLMDTHAGGDVSRIVTGGITALPGDTVRAQMEYLRDDADGLRRLLLEEPYGIPEMSVDLLVPATHPEAAAGYIIMEVMGYPIYSGSNTICTATAVLEAGIVRKQEGKQHFKLESPAGLVSIEATVHDGVVEAITCEGLPSYIHTHNASISVPGIGKVNYSVAYSGGFYALVDARSLGFDLTLDEERRLAETAHAIVEAAASKDDLWVVSCRLGFVSQIVWVNANTVTSDQARTEGQEVPFCARRLEDSLGVNVHPVKDHSEFVDQRDVQISLGVFDNFSGFGNADRRGFVCACRYDRRVEAIDKIGDVRC